MRITNTMMTNNYLRNLNNNMTKLDKYYYQMATGRRITKLSDDPTGVLYSMQARVRLYRNEQYQENVDVAQTWLTQAETSMMELNKVVVTAYESLIQGANDYLSESDKQAIGELIGQLRDHVADLGNSKINDRYVFGGYNTVQAPFVVDANGKLLYNGLDLTDVTDPANLQAITEEDEQVIQLEIGFGIKFDIATPGTKFMGTGDKNIYNTLDELYNLLQTDATHDDLSPYITRLQDAQQEVLSEIADLGGRTNRLDLVTSRYEDEFINYTDMKSQVEDAEYADVIMQYKMTEALYLSSLQVGSRILQPSLLDYLR